MWLNFRRLTAADIADVSYASGVAEGTLVKWRKLERKRLGLLQTAKPRFLPEYRRAMQERLRAGVSVADLSRETGVKAPTLRDWRKAGRTERIASNDVSNKRAEKQPI